MFARLVQRQDYLVQVTVPPGVLVTTPPPTATIQLENGQRKEIQFISPATKTNPSIQGVSLLYTVPASSDLLPGMNVFALLPLESTIDGVVVPEPAHRMVAGTRLGLCPHRLHRPSRAAQLLPIILCLRVVYLVRTLTSGTEVVVQGAQMLLSEEFRAQIQVGEEGAGK